LIHNATLFDMVSIHGTKQVSDLFLHSATDLQWHVVESIYSLSQSHLYEKANKPVLIHHTW
jgi:hypothetical protein